MADTEGSVSGFLRPFGDRIVQIFKGLYVIGGGVVTRRHRSPERRNKASRSQTAYSTPSTYKNGRPRLGLTTVNLAGKPSASSIPSSSTPAALLPDIGDASIGNTSWAFSVKGLPKALHSNIGYPKDGGEISPTGHSHNLCLSAPPGPARRSKEGVKQDANFLPQQHHRNSHVLNGQSFYNATPRAKSAPNMNEMNDLSITTFSLTTRGSVTPGYEQQNTQRYTLPSPSQMFDDCKDETNQSEEYINDAARLPQTPKSKQGQKLNKSNTHLASNFEGKLARIRDILDKSPEYDGPVRYSPSELRSSQQQSRSNSGFDKFLIMRQIPRPERHQRLSPRRDTDTPEQNSSNKQPADIATGSTIHHHGTQRERSMILELNSLSRKHAAKSVRSLESKDPRFNADTSQPAGVPKEEIAKDTMVNDWLGDNSAKSGDNVENGEGKRKIVLSVPNTTGAGVSS